MLSQLWLLVTGRYNWADVTQEIYGVASCDDFLDGSMVFANLSMADGDGKPFDMAKAGWNLTTLKPCNGRTELPDPRTITITHNGPNRTRGLKADDTAPKWVSALGGKGDADLLRWCDVGSGGTVLAHHSRADAMGGVLAGLDARSGDLRWSVETDNTVVFYQPGTLLFAPDTALATVGNQTVAVDIASGGELWRFPTDETPRCADPPGASECSSSPRRSAGCVCKGFDADETPLVAALSSDAKTAVVVRGKLDGSQRYQGEGLTVVGLRTTTRAPLRWTLDIEQSKAHNLLGQLFTAADDGVLIMLGQGMSQTGNALLALPLREGVPAGPATWSIGIGPSQGGVSVDPVPFEGAATVLSNQDNGLTLFACFSRILPQGGMNQTMQSIDAKSGHLQWSKPTDGGVSTLSLTADGSALVFLDYATTITPAGPTPGSTLNLVDTSTGAQISRWSLVEWDCPSPTSSSRVVASNAS